MGHAEFCVTLFLIKRCSKLQPLVGQTFKGTRKGNGALLGGGLKWKREKVRRHKIRAVYGAELEGLRGRRRRGAKVALGGQAVVNRRPRAVMTRSL